MSDASAFVAGYSGEVHNVGSPRFLTGASKCESSSSVLAASRRSHAPRERRPNVVIPPMGARTASTSPLSATSADAVEPPSSLALYDLAVSNFGARVRLVIYLLEIEHLVQMRTPTELGGTKSEAYLALNPQGKVPMLVVERPGQDALPLAESEIIVQYLLDVFPDTGPKSLRIANVHTPELRALARSATRVQDVYLGNLQGSLYKAMDAETRATSIRSLMAQLDLLEILLCRCAKLVGSDSAQDVVFFGGRQICTADCALFPSFVFFEFMLPLFSLDPFQGRRPRLEAWWRALLREGAFEKVRAQIRTELDGWQAKGRWANLGILDQIRDHPQLFKA
ncbi:Glutathione S-transferase DHAR1, mitochondrial [Porphyridium purpureum]|uniref:Glutathione S-transferase DHAR1, mitochondrial n=1 Tax=Porphyridium purpureum TaxID=35688 RepID=A0A5J4YLR7_PORPP|nr:Glutathione S-transferase DHAR1, mitochondrial [Porphyridium purpureum]|eukprot:POR0128..scf295_9